MASQASKPPSKPVQARRLHRKFCAGKQTKGQKSAGSLIICRYISDVKEDFFRNSHNRSQKEHISLL